MEGRCGVGGGGAAPPCASRPSKMSAPRKTRAPTFWTWTDAGACRVPRMRRLSRREGGEKRRQLGRAALISLGMTCWGAFLLVLLNCFDFYFIFYFFYFLFLFSDEVICVCWMSYSGSGCDLSQCLPACLPLSASVPRHRVHEK